MRDNLKILTTALNQLEENKLPAIQKLTAMPMEKLIELRNYYSYWAQVAREEGFKESALVNEAKCWQIFEAIQIKNGNDEQVWDMLT